MPSCRRRSGWSPWPSWRSCRASPRRERLVYQTSKAYPCLLVAATGEPDLARCRKAARSDSGPADHREIRDRYRNGRICKHLTAVGLWERARAVGEGADDGLGVADERTRWANPPGYDAARAVERAGAEELIRCVVAGLFPAGHAILAEVNGVA